MLIKCINMHVRFFFFFKSDTQKAEMDTHAKSQAQQQCSIPFALQLREGKNNYSVYRNARTDRGATHKFCKITIGYRSCHQV